MAIDEDDVFPKPYNVVAAFRAESDARKAAAVLTRRGVPGPAIRVVGQGAGPHGEELAEQRAEMQDELVESWPLPGIALMTEAQFKGAVAGTLTLGAVGFVVGIVAGLVWMLFDSPLSPLGRLAITTLTSVAAFSTIGLIVGGGLNPRRQAAGDPAMELDDQRTGAERDVLLGVHVDECRLAEEAAGVLSELGAERVHCFDEAGTPLPPQSQNPRPADPEGWWWRRAGHG